MSLLVEDCPRCNAKNITFDALSVVPTVLRHDWQRLYEVFCFCRNCRRTTVFILAQVHYKEKEFLAQHTPLEFRDSLNNHFKVEGFIGAKDFAIAPPEHVEEPIANAFREGASSVAVGNWNAAAAMFRLVIDLTTRSMLPKEEVGGLNSRTRRDLGLRLPWLFDNGLLPNDLRRLSACVREDGNDGAHAGTITKEDALDLLDFTTSLLERIISEPKRIELAEERRKRRRGKGTPPAG